MNVILSASHALDGFVPVLNPETGERFRVSGYAAGTRTKKRRVALIRAMLNRAIELGAQYPAETVAQVMADDDAADSLATRYVGTASGLTLTAYDDGATFGYSHDSGGGGNYPMAQLVILEA